MIRDKIPLDRYGLLLSKLAVYNSIVVTWENNSVSHSLNQVAFQPFRWKQRSGFTRQLWRAFRITSKEQGLEDKLQQ